MINGTGKTHGAQKFAYFSIPGRTKIRTSNPLKMLLIFIP